jgi:hypothetical protein
MSRFSELDKQASPTKRQRNQGLQYCIISLRIPRFPLAAAPLLVAITLVLSIPISVNTALAGIIKPCAIDSLHTKTVGPEVAAETSYFQLEILNGRSSDMCKLSGIPNAQPGIVIKWPEAMRPVGLPSIRQTKIGRGAAVDIRPGGVANLEFEVIDSGNYLAKRCKATSVTELLVNFGRRQLTGLRFRIPATLVCTLLSNTYITGIGNGPGHI